MRELIWAEGLLLAVVLLVMPLYAVWASKQQDPGTVPKLKGLGLPEGSIRGMLAIMSVGSFVILLVLGPAAPEMKEFFDKSLAAFGTLTGAIIGFYFGNRGTEAASTTGGSTTPSTAPVTAAPATTERETTTGETAQSAGSDPAATKPT